MPDLDFQPGGPFQVSSLLETVPHSIVSRTLLKSPAGTVTLFAFAAGEGLSPHSAPYDALALVTKGIARITVGDRTHDVIEGSGILLPANLFHAVRAETDLGFLLVMIKG